MAGSLLVPIIIIMLLILLNAAFVAAEFALISAPRAVIDRRAAKGEYAAGIVQKILKNPAEQDFFIGTAQIGITVVSFGLGMYGEETVAEWFLGFFGSFGRGGWIASHSVSSVLTIVILTYFHVVIGEMMPKTLALQKAETASLWITPPMMWLRTLVYPLALALNGVAAGILRILGIKRQITSGHYYSAEELRYIVQESQESGLLREEAGKVVRQLFEFGELSAGEVMVPRVRIRGIPMGADPEAIREILKKSVFTRYPVYESDLDHITGMVHIKDILKILLENRSINKNDIRPIPFVSKASDIDSVLSVMRRSQAHMVIVMDEYGGTSGLATLEDLFEEVIGDMEEGAGKRAEIYTDSRGLVYADGATRLDKIGDYIDMELEHEEVDTLGGLVLVLLDRPPQIGDIVSYSGVTFTVTGVEGHGVRECIVRQPR